MKQTSTSSFGVGKREGHDASPFYGRSLYKNGGGSQGQGARGEGRGTDYTSEKAPDQQSAIRNPQSAIQEWADRIYCQSAEAMTPIPDNSVALAFTSPPYNAGKTYDDDLDLPAYLALIRNVASEVYRVLQPGGRYVVNIANLGRKPYIPLHMYFYQEHMAVGFLPMGEIIWRKAKGANGSCAWGSWQSAKAPRLRDTHEYLLVFTKEVFSRPDRGVSDVGRDEFLEATLSVWEIPPESAKRVGHPAPFPVALAERVIRLYSYVDDVVLDPFMGSGSTCVAAVQNGRHYVGFDIAKEYCTLAQQRIATVQQQNKVDADNAD